MRLQTLQAAGMELTALTFPGLTRGSTRAVIMVLACMRQEALTAEGDKERKVQRSVSFEKTVKPIRATAVANQLPGQYLKYHNKKITSVRYELIL
jgi:hypothetical protein